VKTSIQEQIRESLLKKKKEILKKEQDKQKKRAKQLGEGATARFVKLASLRVFNRRLKSVLCSLTIP